ncbi:DNA helicase/exodeoxyribonuclease V, subunit B [Carnobacterium iners]|uniref:DNA helicase/exodeoxyribonuclease V, subunit B n=1 Tax=Carnobacterium iners TaxID=1073423 RepID=A0A1X7NF81_9LACT|nr:PD-(D/E)XK nuclease family protein [Carnobacterium iners]SEK39478.1 DNA helicase/exodeoxyribonuclease V, subunit B [Carnobacterium iners]SMH36399.1 DNA helicase/exodeoxyribonuclease V, subunit B [Carnobacterium iners]
MGLQFILGRANRDKRGFMLDEIATTLNTNKQAKVFYLVPDHIKFEAEMTVLEKIGERPPFNENKMMGMMNLQVFSFNRLAWYWLQDTDIFIKPQLTSSGLSMLVRKLLIDYEQQLVIYRGEVRKTGFVQQLTDLFLELRTGRISQDDLAGLIHQLGSSPQEVDFQLKLKDISLLYQAFDASLMGKYVETEDIMTALIKKLQEVDLSETIIYIESYFRFTAQEQALILALMHSAKKVTISLTLDKGYPSEKPGMHELFQAAGETYYKLYQLARTEHIPVAPDRLIQQIDASYCEELNQLEDFWVESTKLSPIDFNLKKQQLPMDDCVKIWVAEDKQAEVSHVAKEIRKMIKSEKYRYKDILILTRNTQDYLTILGPIFAENGIETFIDSADLMTQHPLVELIDAILTIKRKNWRYTDVMRLLRTELFIPELSSELPVDRKTRIQSIQNQVNQFRNKIDLTENVVLAYGYEGYQWTMKEPWHYTKFYYDDTDFQSDSDQRIENTANQVRFLLKNALLPFFAQLEKAKTGADAAKILYLFLEKIGVDTQLTFWRDQAIESNDLETAKKHEQIWAVLLQLLDEYVEVLGEESFEMESFQAILSAGFENASYSIVPPNIDQVIFSGLEGTRIATAKITFLLGMTDVHMPAKSENKSMLTNEDRTFFSEFLASGKYLKPSSEDLMASEPFIAYNAFLDSSEQLIFSYPLNSDSKETAKLSPYLERIGKQFSLPIQFKGSEISSIENPTPKETLSFIGTKQSTMSQLLLVLRKEQDKKGELSPFWKGVYCYFKRDKNLALPFHHLLTSLVKKNIPHPLKSEIATSLYGKDLYLSVSRLETFYADPYNHFLQYGLKLKERDRFGLSPAGTGEFFHDALDQLFKSLLTRELTLANLDTETIELITDEVLAVLFKKPKFSILSASNRMKFIRSQLSQTIKRMVWALGNQSRRTNMKTVQTEVLFGQLANQKGIEGLSFPLNNGGTLFIRGKIDRVDAVEVENQHYLSVVDYKSSAHKFNYFEAYYGLAMQMITYLDTALSNATELIGHSAKPVGAFYVHVKNPFIKETKITDEESIATEFLKEFKLDGLLLEEEELLLALDHTIEPTTASFVYPFKQLKDKSLKSSGFVTLEEMAALRMHNQKLIMDAGNAITKGVTTLHPFFEKKQHISTVSGEFKAVSQFDYMLPENNYRKEEKLKREDILKLILAEKEENE